jgi:hypothetical protein
VTDATFERIVEFVKRNSIPGIGRAGEVPIYVSEEVPDDEPDLSEGEYAVGIRMSPADHEDLKRRVQAMKGERDVLLR